MPKYQLSPCVQSAVNTLDDEVTHWDLAKYLIELHPEYTNGLVKPHISQIDQAYTGFTKNIQAIFADISNHYPSENMLHTQLVILALSEIDDSLKELIPQEAMQIIRQNLSFD